MAYAKFPATFTGIILPADIELVLRVLAEYDSAPLRAAEGRVSLAFGDVDRAREQLEKATNALIEAEERLLQECRDLDKSERINQAMAIRDAITGYLREKYGPGDKTWHPLFVGGRELFIQLMDGIA